MIHLIKYKFIQTVRDWSIMFWALAFPLILSTLFYVSFGSAGLSSTGEKEWSAVPVAVVTVDDSAQSARAFKEFLAGIDGDIIDIRRISQETDVTASLKEETISGIFYVDETPSLTVGRSGLNESILKSVLDSYNQNASVIASVARSHPENLSAALNAAGDYRNMTREVTLGGNTMDPSVCYFFALIAYACLSGAFLGVRSSFDSQADLSPLGARRSVTPTHKLKLILVDLLVLFVIHFVNILVLTTYISQVLGVSLGSNTGGLFVVNLMGSMIGVSLGLLIGCIGKLSESAKIWMTVASTLSLGFLAGLMTGNMKYIIEKSCPILNRINPAAVLSDAYYSLGVYSNMDTYRRSLIILGVMSAGFVTVAFLGVRRERYDSI